MPTISIDTSFFDRILNSPDPLVAAWYIFLAGGWIPVVLVMIKGLSWAWLNERQGIFMSKQKKVFLAVDVPKNNEQLPRAVENIFAHLQGAYSSPTKKEKWFDGKLGAVFGFEIISIGGYVQFVISSWEKYRDLIEALIYAQYPEAEITEIEDYTDFAPQKWPDKEHMMFAAEFITKRSQFYPLRTYLDFKDQFSGDFKDPMAGFLESLSRLRPDEQVWYQILIQLNHQEWAEGGEKLIKELIGAPPPDAKPSLIGKVVDFPLEVLTTALSTAETAPVRKERVPRSEMISLSPGEKNVVEAVERKVTKIGHASKIRMIYIAPKKTARTSEVISFVRGSLNQFTSHDMNSLKFNGSVITKRDYFWQQNSLWYYLSGTFYRTVNERMRLNFRGYKKRSLWTGGKTFVLNAEELATLWHFPVIEVKPTQLKKSEAKRTEPPVGLPTEAVRPFVKKVPEAAPPRPIDEPEPALAPPEDLPFE